MEEYQKIKNQFRDPKKKKKLLWEEISKHMTLKGYSINAEIADRKMRNMKNTYRTIVDNNNKKKTQEEGVFRGNISIYLKTYSRRIKQ